MTDFWNQKYNTTDYLYGTEPNEFFKKELVKLKLGNILLPAEGEGRNAVFAAKVGWKVTAFDPSSMGRQKALNLAKENEVSISYVLQGYEHVTFPVNSFDAIGLTFTHIPPDLRRIMHTKYISWLKPSGTLIMEAFSIEQLKYNSGGPKDIQMLFSVDELKTDFSGLTELNILLQTVELNEGIGHQGMASVIRLVGVK